MLISRDFHVRLVNHRISNIEVSFVVRGVISLCALFVRLIVIAEAAHFKPATSVLKKKYRENGETLETYTIYSTYFGELEV